MDPRFSLLTFPQRFDGARLHLRVLVVPRLGTGWSGDPLQPAIENFPAAGDPAAAFADADLQLEAHVLAGLDRFPVNDPVDHAAPLPAASGVAADARALFAELVAPGPGRFRISAGLPGPTDLAEAPKPEGVPAIQKYLPRSYRESFLFTGPRTRDALTDDRYHCAVKERKDPNPLFRPSPSEVSWGEVYAFCLRHHQLARRLGLIRAGSFAVPDGLFAEGGFLYVDLAAGSDYAPQTAADFTFLARYAARIPRLEAGTERRLFAAVEFPVVFDDPLVPGPPPAPGTYDAVFIEAADYDDGFAKIVHATQPVSQHLLAEDPDGFAPLTDVGIRLGWDDEQILIWQNRQLKEDPTVLPKVPGKPQRLDAPMGVFGYRVDARAKGDPAWHTLVAVRSKAPLALGGIPLGEPPGDRWAGELAVEVHPMQLDGYQDTSQFWLPAYLAQWNGASLVLPDEDAAALFKTEEADGTAARLGRMYDPVGLDDVPLRYGRTYELRVRLMDPTGGGPPAGAEPVHESPAPKATVPFRRHVVPEPVRIPGLPKFPEADLDALFPDDALEVGRPLLGYPSVVFTGKYADPIPLLQAASDAAVGSDSFGIPDPDVRLVEVDVEVRALRMDNQLSRSKREAWALLYTTHRAFPADFDAPCVIPLAFRDAAVLHFGDPGDLGDLGLTVAAIDAMDELPLPRARDIRLTIRAVAGEDAAYFAHGAHVGKPVQVRVRREAEDETGLLAETSRAKQLRGIYLQPDPAPAFDGTLAPLLFHRTTGRSPAIIQRLAQQLGVDHKGMTLVGKHGERVVFGCSRRIRHTLAPDNSSLTIAAKDDLVNHWLVALTLQLDRDWTWDGLAHVSFEIFREKRFRADAEVDDNGGRPIGDWEVIPTAPLQALEKPRRGHTTLVFLDAVEPKSERPQAGNPAETRFPDVIELDYRIEPRFRTAPADSDPPETLHLDLPVTTTPAQVPVIVSAGLALSQYRRNETYSATEARRRFLWLELDRPPRDPNDRYFIGPLGYAPDPLLSDNRFETFVPPEEPPLGIDPELVRVITPDQPDDEAGLAAMVPLEAGKGGRHFLVPLPPGLNADSPELFGFFTYELRVGHARIWSTAQGRFGRPLRSTGVQHPAPTLFCTCQRDENALLVEAPFAEAVLNGKNVTADPPRTEIWALLYTQVRQADGKDWRNVLLDDRELRLRPRLRGRLVDADTRLGLLPGAFQNSDATARGATRWSQDEIAALLRELGLPQDAPLSVLCVEMMPTLAALRVRDPHDAQRANLDPAAAVHAERSGTGHDPAAPPDEGKARPLTDALGHYRILRTSPLTEVPEVCCPTC